MVYDSSGLVLYTHIAAKKEGRSEKESLRGNMHGVSDVLKDLITDMISFN